MGKRAVVVKIHKKSSSIGYVAEVRPHKGVFTREELEGWLEDPWTEKVGNSRQMSSIPDYSEMDPPITLVCAEGVSPEEFASKAHELIGELFHIRSVDVDDEALKS